MRTELSWTFVSPIPLLYHDKKTGVDLCFWNGTSITRNYGRMLAGTIWCNIYYPSTVKKAAFNEYKRAYLANAFETKDWDSTVLNHDEVSFLSLIPKLICRKDAEFLKKLKTNYTAAQAMSWFEQERMLDNER